MKNIFEIFIIPATITFILLFYLYNTDHFSYNAKECIGLNQIYETNYSKLWKNRKDEYFLKKWIKEKKTKARA